MEFELTSARQVLSRTPSVLTTLVAGLPEGWTHVNEGPDTWSVFDVVGHLIHGELTDWIPRARIILEHGPAKAFEPFDRFAQLEANKGKSLADLLDRFAIARRESLTALDEMRLTPEQMTRQGTHPAFGAVTLGEL